MAKPFLRVDRDGPVATITFDRPEKLNAWAWGPTNELCAAADEIRFDPSVRAVVLQGEGRAFCAGEDLKPETDGVEERHPGRSAAERTLLAYERAKYCFERWGVVDQLPQPVIAAIHGYCLGAGLEIAMLADIRVAATDAVFALPQVTLGIQVVAGADLRMVSELGAGRTKLLAMTGRRFGAAEAEQWGLVQQVVAPDDLQRDGDGARPRDRPQRTPRRPGRETGRQLRGLPRASARPPSTRRWRRRSCGRRMT